MVIINVATLLLKYIVNYLNNVVPVVSHISAHKGYVSLS